LLWLPLAALLVLRLVRRGGEDAQSRRGDVRVLAIVALGLGAMPVLVSTASALETQAFVLVYFLGFAFLMEELASRVAHGT
jgi:hypothetical protein